MNNFAKIKRFFSPLAWDKIFVIKALTWFTLWWMDSLLVAVVVKSLTQSIQAWKTLEFHYGLMFFTFWIFMYHIFAYFMLRWWYVDYKINENLNTVIFPEFFHIENNYFEKIGTWRCISILQKWIDNWSSLVQEILTRIPMAIIFFGMALYIIISINYYFLISFIVLLLLVSWLIHVIQKKWLNHRRQKKEMISEYSRQFIRNIMSKFEILQSDKINKEILNLNEKLDEILEIQKKQHTFEHITFNIWNVTTNITRWLLLFFVWSRILEGTANFSDLVLVITVIWYFQKSIDDITEIYKKIMKTFPDVIKLWEFVDESPKMRNINEWADLILKKWAIKLENISFGYGENNLIFDNFSLDIKEWVKTALVGKSWGGKSTLIKLIAGYITPNSWEILVDWQKMSEIKLMDFYKNIGYLTQDPSVFDGTIYENLTYALDHDPSEKEVNNAIMNSKCEFILEFETGLDTEIWERWIRLSGWQKQRLAIAKIMLKNPNIILLDEPTSALDSISEQAVSEAFHNLFRWRTVIIIAHRLQTVKEADDIIVIEGWQILERWIHSELVEQNWIYAKMLELQSGF